MFAAASLTEVFTELGTRFETAGLVYVTDVAAARRTVHGVSFAEAGAARTPYPITVVKNAPQPDLAVRFQRLVTADRARSPNHSSCGSLSVSHSADENLL